MSGIKRYVLSHGKGMSCMQLHKDGGYMDFEEHQAIIAAKDEEIYLGRAKYAAYRAEMVEELQNQANVIVQKDEEIARLKEQLTQSKSFAYGQYKLANIETIRADNAERRVAELEQQMKERG